MVTRNLLGVELFKPRSFNHREGYQLLFIISIVPTDNGAMSSPIIFMQLTTIHFLAKLRHFVWFVTKELMKQISVRRDLNFSNHLTFQGDFLI
ncbi:hypothetical protein Leryth_024072 [Lithospermum erythrorhizon]|nr:hypothetical protein Leryth_024072 [Lithospermum erythrorhizon]